MSSHRIIVVLAAVVGTLVLIVSHVLAVDAHLAWEAPPTAGDTPPQEVAGYNIYYGLTSQLYDFVIDVGNTTAYTLSGLKPGQRYYFSVVAYDNSLNESLSSEEVSMTTAVGSTSDGMDSDG